MRSHLGLRWVGLTAAAQQVSQMMRTMRHHRDGGPDLIIGGAGGDATRDEEEVSSQVFKQRRRGMYAFATFSCDSQVAPHAPIHMLQSHALSCCALGFQLGGTCVVILCVVVVVLSPMK